MTSRIGVIMVCPRFDLPTQIPSGNPTTTQMIDAATTSDSVSIAVCQKPNSAR